MRHDPFAERVRNWRRALQHLRDRSRVQTGALLVRRILHDRMLYECRRMRDLVGSSVRRSGNGVYRLRRRANLQRGGQVRLHRSFVFGRLLRRDRRLRAVSRAEQG